MVNDFLYLPTPQILHWLSAGQLANRLQRSVRLWVVLWRLYNSEVNWAEDLPQPFTYPDLRDRLFASSHSRSESLKAEALTNGCPGTHCICQKTLRDWIFQREGVPGETEWVQEMTHLTGLKGEDLREQFMQQPFKTVHRSLRDDLKLLTELGWLQQLRSGHYQCQPRKHWPQLPQESRGGFNFAGLSPAETWDMMHVLDSLSYVQPSLTPVIQALWEQAASLSVTPRSASATTEPLQRIFIELDYILPDDVQDRVDNYQDQLTQLWRSPDAGVVQFQYQMVRQGREVMVTVHPVCIHYVRRAKYLSAYGLDPEGQLAWHNYRLDRITSDRLKVLPWGDPDVPPALKERWRTGRLFTPEDVRQQLRVAWGFNFYLKAELLILRFPAEFARWYVEGTVRHETFQKVQHRHLPALIKREVPNLQEQGELLEVVERRSPTDHYYRGWVRTDDINVIMRLRDWRPNSEVIAPLALRRRMAEEAKAEIQHYWE